MLNSEKEGNFCRCFSLFAMHTKYLHKLPLLFQCILRDNKALASKGKCCWPTICVSSIVLAFSVFEAHVQQHSRLKLQFCTCNNIKYGTRVYQKDIENAKTLGKRQYHMPVTVPHKTIIDRQNFSFYIKASGKESNFIRIWTSKNTFLNLLMLLQNDLCVKCRDQLGNSDFNSGAEQDVLQLCESFYFLFCEMEH